MKINAHDVKKVASLARLNLPDNEIENHAIQLEKILSYVAQLEKIDTTDVTPTTRAVEVLNVTREDKIVPFNSREEILELAPLRQENFYRVPKIL